MEMPPTALSPEACKHLGDVLAHGGFDAVEADLAAELQAALAGAGLTAPAKPSPGFIIREGGARVNVSAHFDDAYECHRISVWVLPRDSGPDAELLGARVEQFLKSLAGAEGGKGPPCSDF